MTDLTESLDVSQCSPTPNLYFSTPFLLSNEDFNHCLLYCQPPCLAVSIMNSLNPRGRHCKPVRVNGLTGCWFHCSSPKGSRESCSSLTSRACQEWEGRRRDGRGSQARSCVFSKHCLENGPAL